MPLFTISADSNRQVMI